MSHRPLASGRSVQPSGAGSQRYSASVSPASLPRIRRQASSNVLVIAVPTLSIRQASLPPPKPHHDPSEETALALTLGSESPVACETGPEGDDHEVDAVASVEFRQQVPYVGLGGAE